MRLQAVDFDRYQARGTSDEGASKDSWRDVLRDDLERIKAAAAVLHEAKVRGRDGLTTPGLETAYYTLRARLGAAATEMIRDLPPGWYEALTQFIRHDLDVLKAAETKGKLSRGNAGQPSSADRRQPTSADPHGRQASNPARLEWLIPDLPRIHRMRPEARLRLAEWIPELVADADWSDVRGLALAISAAVLPEGPGDAVYRSLHTACPETSSRADLEFLLRAAEVLRLEAEPSAGRRALTRGVLAFLESDSPGPVLAATLRHWLAPTPDGWTAGDLDPLIEIVKARAGFGRLPEALDRLGPIVALLTDREAERDSLLSQLAAIVEPRWAQPAPDEAARAQRLAALKAFAELVSEAGKTHWSRETPNDLWAGLPRDVTRPAGWLPSSFDPVARAWLLGQEAPAARRAYLVDVIVLTLERQAACPDPVALDRLVGWLGQRKAEPGVYRAVARLRVARLAEEFADDPIRLARELDTITSVGPARAVRSDLTRLAETVALRPRVAPIEPDWNLAVGWDEVAIAACTDPRQRWPAELARWLMTGLLRGRSGEVAIWSKELNRAALEDLCAGTWDEVLGGFEARVAAGRLTDGDLEALDALAQWLEDRKLPLDTFRRERDDIRSNPRTPEDPIAARLRLAAALRRRGPVRRSEPSTDRPGRVEPRHRGVAHPGITRAALAVAVLGLIAGAFALPWPSRAPAPTTKSSTSKDRPPPPPAPTPPPEPESILTANYGERSRSDPFKLYLHREPHEHLSIDLVVCDPNDHKGLESKLYVASTETTRAQYKIVMKEFPPAAKNADGPEFPATNVTWKDAEEFCRRIQSALGLDAKEVRLPSDSEWRCLAGRQPPEPLKSFAVYDEKEAMAPAKVKTTKLAYPPGIYDLWGNAREWLRGSDHGELGESKYILYSVLGGSRRDSAEDLEKNLQFRGDKKDDFLGFRIVVIPAQ